MNVILYVRAFKFKWVTAGQTWKQTDTLTLTYTLKQTITSKLKNFQEKRKKKKT